MASEIVPTALMTGARQTMMSWARVIDMLQDMPGVFRYPFQALAGEGEALPYSVLAPAQGGGRGRKPAERLLCDLGDTFYLLERAGSKVAVTGFRYADICSLELGNILLYSWFTVHGTTCDGEPAARTVEFNEATLRHFEPFFRRMRPAAAAAAPAGMPAELAKFDFLAEANFKLMNFGRESLIPGQRVIRAVYQPGARRQILALFGRGIYRTEFLAHLTVLTGQEVILLGDAENITENKRSKYGGVRRYLPLSRLAGVSLDERPNAQLALTLHLPGGVAVQRLFDAGRLAELTALKQAIEARLG